MASNALAITEEGIRESIRFTEVDGRKVFSVYDLMRVALPEQSDEARWKMFQRIKEEYFDL